MTHWRTSHDDGDFESTKDNAALWFAMLCIIIPPLLCLAFYLFLRSFQ